MRAVPLPRPGTDRATVFAELGVERAAIGTGHFIVLIKDLATDNLVGWTLLHRRTRRSILQFDQLIRREVLIVRGRRSAAGLRPAITDRQPAVLGDDFLRHELSGGGQLAVIEFEALQLDFRPQRACRTSAATRCR